MDTLLKEIYDMICNNISKICDLRNISRTCKYFNNICIPKIKNLENEYIIKYDDMGFCKYLKIFCNKKFIIEIILDGYYNFLKDEYYNNKIMCDMLSLVGNFELLQYVVSKGCEYDEYTIKCASYGGHINILEYFYNLDKKQFYYSECHDNACYSNKTNVLDWLKSKNYAFISNNFVPAIKRNSLDVIQWMVDNNIEFTDNCISWIIYYDNTEMLKLLGDRCKLMQNKICMYAINFAATNVLQMLQNNNVNITNNNYKICSIKYDSPNKLQWCISNGVSINTDKLCSDLIKNNMINNFIWLYNIDNCDIGDDVYKYYEPTCDLQIMEFCLEKSICNVDNMFNYIINKDYDELLKLFLKYIKKKLNYIHSTSSSKCFEILKNYDNIDMYITSYGMHNFEISEIDNLMKFPFLCRKMHIHIINKKIKIERYEHDYFHNKIITIDNFGNILSDDLLCDNKCWIYFSIMKDCHHNNSDKYANNIEYCKNNMCGIHKPYLQFIKN